MSSIDDRYIRLQALERAMKLYKDSPTVVSPDQVIQAAEKFRAFLAGEDAQPEPFKAKDGLPVFKLPRLYDGYVYFRFLDSDILYRSPAVLGALTEATERLSSQVETKWRPATGSLATRAGLRKHADYNEVSSAVARTILVANIKGHRFE